MYKFVRLVLGSLFLLASIVLMALWVNLWGNISSGVCAGLHIALPILALAFIMFGFHYIHTADQKKDNLFLGLVFRIIFYAPILAVIGGIIGYVGGIVIAFIVGIIGEWFFHLRNLNSIISPITTVSTILGILILNGYLLSDEIKRSKWWLFREGTIKLAGDLAHSDNYPYDMLYSTCTCKKEPNTICRGKYVYQCSKCGKFFCDTHGSTSGIYIRWLCHHCNRYLQAAFRQAGFY